MAATPSTMLDLGIKAPAFNLPDFDGKNVSISQFNSKPLLVMFISNHCPFVKHVAKKVGQLGKEFQQKGVNVVAIMSNNFIAYPDDSPEKMKEFAESNNFTFPYLVDESQEIAKAYRAACTPDFFLFDQELQLAYRGQMDGSRPSNDVPVTGIDLVNAVNNLVAGIPIDENQVPSIGCNIKWTPGNQPDYFG
jgi:peroxiredoxin